ncbi:MAG: ROK family protein [Acidobacteriia bacterium]|nr:ROK family protein [Terriglobia bacterium]
MAAVGAIDIGGTKIAVGVVDESGRVLARRECPTDASRGYEDALARMCAMLRDAVQRGKQSIDGIGIGSTGPVDPFTGVIGKLDFLPGWEGSPLVDDLAREFGLAVAMENDGDAAALGEAGWGAGRDKANLAYVTVGTGIGVGIIADGKLYRGAGGAHPEIGHHVIDCTGPLCSCGAHGCWESLATGPAMAQWLSSNAPPDYPHLDGLTGKRICELARQGDAPARRAVEREARYLGIGVANLVTLFIPDTIVLGGSVMHSADLFLDTIRDTVRRHCGYVPFEKTVVALASLGPDANLIGAARVWHHRFAPDGPRK